MGIMKKERINEIWGILFLLLGLFTLTSLLSFHTEDLSFYNSDPANPIRNVAGVIGAYLAFGLRISFGLSAYLIPGLFLLWAFCFFAQRVPEKKFFKFVGLGIALFATSTLLALYSPVNERFQDGGAVGYVAGGHLLRYFGFGGSTLLSGACLLLSILLATDFLIYPIVKNLLEQMQDFFAGCSELGEKFKDGVVFIAGLFRRGKERVPARSEKSEKAEKAVKPAKSEKNEKIEKLIKAVSAVKAEKEKDEPKSALPEIPLKVKQYRPDLDSAASDKARKEEMEKAEEKISKMAKTPKTPYADAAAGITPETKQTPAPAPVTKPAAAEEKRFEGVIGNKGDMAYQFPSLDLLKRPVAGAAPKDNLQENSKILEATLAEFGIDVRVIEVEQGPVITRYELLPAPGVKVNSISAVADDIALALKAVSVRLIIPIPGKSAVGVEVPNSVASAVYLRELVESSAFRNKKLALPLAIGKDTSGKPLIADLASMPHMLIAGTTGSGKTVCVNAIITGLLYTCSPQDLKFVMVDPKMVELACYNKLPHMLAPVVTDVKKAAATLNWVVTEMENRYKLFAAVGVRNIQAFNTRPISEEAKQEMEKAPGENTVPVKLPYIVVIIDELADLMMVAADKVETAIARLAQLSRAVGIHLLLATQRPSVDVITGVIKANFPARISFKVASKVDSRTVLDASGADKLIGKGDMLFIQPGDSKAIRGQAALIVDEEINNVVKFVSEQAKPEYHPEIVAGPGGAKSDNPMEKDELFDEAVAVVLETGQASTSNLQRRLRLGYTRAARIIDQMEAEGLIGPAQGAKPRDILISRDEAPSPVKAI